MRNLIAVVALVAAVCMASVGSAGAAEKAATDQLPEALTVLGAEQSQVVTVEEAQKVRGENFRMFVDLNVWNRVTDSYVNTQGRQLFEHMDRPQHIYLRGVVNTERGGTFAGTDVDIARVNHHIGTTRHNGTCRTKPTSPIFRYIPTVALGPSSGKF